MLFFLQAWRLRSEKSAVNSDVDDLILLYGAHAYEEARRRRAHADDLSAARHWGAVKSEMGRRILETCADTGALEALESRLAEVDRYGRSLWDPATESAHQALRLANRIQSVRDEGADGGRRPAPSSRNVASGTVDGSLFPGWRRRSAAQSLCYPA